MTNEQELWLAGIGVNAGAILQSVAAAGLGPGAMAVAATASIAMGAVHAAEGGLAKPIDGQPSPAPPSGSFVADESKRKDKQFARKEAQADAARIGKSGTLSAKDRQTVNAKLQFFQGEAWEVYGKEIKPALAQATELDKRKREDAEAEEQRRKDTEAAQRQQEEKRNNEGMAAYYASTRQSQLDSLAEKRAEVAREAPHMTPEQIDSQWKDKKDAFVAVASSPGHRLKPEQFIWIYVKHWAEREKWGKETVRRIADKEESAAGFGEYYSKITRFYGGERDAMGPEFAKAVDESATGEAMLRQTVFVTELLRAAESQGKSLTLEEVEKIALLQNRLGGIDPDAAIYLADLGLPELELPNEIEPPSVPRATPESEPVPAATPPEPPIGSAPPNAPSQTPTPAAVPPPTSPRVGGFGRESEPPATAPTPAPANEPPPTSPRVGGFGRGSEPPATAPTPAPANAPPPTSSRVGGFGRESEPPATTPTPAPANAPPPTSPRVGGFGRESEPPATAPTPTPANAPPPTSPRVGGFGRESEPPATAPAPANKPPVDTQMPPARVEPSPSTSPGAGATSQRRDQPATATSKPTGGGEPELEPAKTSGGEGAGGGAGGKGPPGGAPAATPVLLTPDELNAFVPQAKRVIGEKRRLTTEERKTANEVQSVLMDVNRGDADAIKKLDELRPHVHTSGEFDGWWSVDLVRGNPGALNIMRLYFRKGKGGLFEAKIRQGH